MTAVRDWLAGKKTYIVAGVLIAIGLIFVLDQDVTNDDMGISFIVVALGMMAAGMEVASEAMVASAVESK